MLLIIGPSGSGKTTLLSIVGCLLRPSAGRLRIAGSDVAAMTQSRLTDFRLRTFGFVFQSFRLLSGMTAAENVELPLNASGVLRPRSQARAEQLLDRVGLAHRAQFPADTLSPGEKQRVAVARALAVDPPLLLADEPTGSLDSRAGEEVIDLLCAAASEHKKAVVIVSHDLRIEDRADRVLQMEDGWLGDAGRPASHLQ